MAENKRINVTELDFDQIKLNLKSFLKGQDEFSDYDFEGSAMSVLLDVLAYNTHYNALYNNLSINEMFLDSASKRNSIVSLSKLIGYTPRSATCATATVNLTITSPSTGPSVVSIPAYTQFNTTINGKGYSFYNTSELTAVGASTSYSITDVILTEGTPLTFRYDVASGVRYIIPNQNIDLATLKIRVQENSSSSTYYAYTEAGNIVDVDSTSKVFWVKEIDDGLYEITFGNGIIGTALQSGNVVHMDYFVSSLDAVNGARLFTYGGSTPYSGASVSITTTSVATGGSKPEAIDSIRFNAPRAYSAQNRAVTPDDYKALIYANFPEAKSISVWGGEDNNPPIYGKTYICIKPKTAGKLTLQQKSDIVNTILANRSVVSITPEILDPDYINIALTTTVYYNERETTRSSTDIANIVRSTILNYNDTDLQRFDSVFRFSKLSRLIDASEPSIVSNITTVLLRRKVAPRYNISAEYNINVINPIYTEGVPEEAVSSTGFYIQGSDYVHYLRDDGQGNIVLYYRSVASVSSSSTDVVVNAYIGKVDYANGLINIKNLNITNLADVDFEITIKPQSNDVVSAWTQIAEVATDHLVVSAIADKTASGDLRAGKNFVFTSSRS